MSFLKRNNIIITVVVLALAAVLAWQLFFGATGGPSQDTARLLEMFGNPSSFTVYLAGENGREEVWDYQELGIAVSFADGKYIGTFESQDERTETVTSPYSPTQFPESATLGKINNIVGEEPAITADINPELLSGAKMYVYSSGLIVTTVEDRISSIHFQ